MMPRRAADRSRVLTAAGIVALHVAALLLIHRHDAPDTPAQGAIVYMQLQLPPLRAPASLPAKPEPVNAVPIQARESAAPRPDLSAPTPATAPVATPVPGDEARPPDVPADWADTPAHTVGGKVDVAALVAAAGDNERARHKEPLERVRDSQRIRGSMDDSPGARAIAKSGRPDCTKKYAGGANLDPLLLIPLLYDTVTDTGCKW